MNFSRLHACTVFLMVGCAVAALLLSGTLGGASTVALPALFLLAAVNGFQDPSPIVLPARAGGGISVALVLYALLSLNDQKDISGVAANFAGYLLVLRLFTRDSARSDIQLAVLSLFAFLSVALLTPSVDYGAFLTLYMLVSPLALALSHLRGAVEKNQRSGAKDRSGARVDLSRILRSKRVLNRHFVGLALFLVAPIVIGTLFVFFLFPRVGLAAVQLQLNTNKSRVGFSSDVVLSGGAAPEEDSTIALRLKPPAGIPTPTSLGAYLRGAVAVTDGLDGMRSTPPTLGLKPSDARCQRDLTHAYLQMGEGPMWTAESLLPDQIYLFLPLAHSNVTLQKPTSACISERVTTHEATLSVSSPGSRYVFTGDIDGAERLEELSDSEREKLLATTTLTKETLAKARDMFPTARTARATAESMVEIFHKNYVYDLGSPSKRAENPLADFLFNTKRGHCEFYATSMALLLREKGVPARVVTGYAGGVFNSYGGFYSFRQSDAHAWVEAYIDADKRWVRYDPTPSARVDLQQQNNSSAFREFYDAAAATWQRYFVSYDLNRQQDLIERASRKVTPEPNAGSSGFFSKLRRMSSNKVAIVFALAAAAILISRRRKAKKAAGTTREVARTLKHASALERALERQGYARGAQETTAAFARRAATSHPAQEALRSYASTYEDVRYGEAKLTHERRAAFAGWLRTIREANNGKPL